MFRRISNLALNEYRHFFSLKKLMIMMFSFIIMYEDIVKKMLDLSKESGFKLNVLEPYDLLLSYNIHAMIIPFTYMLLIQDFPDYSTSSYFHMSRMSRREWLCGQLAYAFMVAITYITLFFSSTIIPALTKGIFSSKWSSYMNELYYSDDLLYMMNNQLFIDASTVCHGGPVYVCLYSSILMIIYMVIIAELLMLFNLKKLKKIGFVITTLIIVLSSATVELNGDIKWFFPMAHAMYGTHFNIFLREPICELYKSFIYFGVLIAVLTIINSILVKRISIGESET